MILPLCVGLIFLTEVKSGLQSPDVVVMFASLGDSIALPCSINSIRSCSSINWNKSDYRGFEERTVLVKDGTVATPHTHKFQLLRDCSLQINHMETDDARLYTCDNGNLNSSIALPVLQLTENLELEPPRKPDEIELQCYLNTHKGSPVCNFSQIQIRWTTEDNAPTHRLNSRLRIEHSNKCLSKLFIKKKPTDHFRKWKCQLVQNDSIAATAAYTTKIADGIEEVFAVVGESVSFSCSNTSSLALNGKRQLQGIFENKGSASVIRKVTALHAGDYQCSNPTSKFRLHTLDITSEYGPQGTSLTLACALTCANRPCEEDFNLTWSESDPNSWQSLMNQNNNLINKLFVPVLPMRSNEVVCSVHREGAVVASKKWTQTNSLHSIAWIALPLVLLICVIAGGVYVCMKRKHKKDTEDEHADIGMAHVYEDIQDCNNEEVHQRSQFRREPATTDSFYDLLQAVN